MVLFFHPLMNLRHSSVAEVRACVPSSESIKVHARMADQKQIRMLKRSVHEWNEWRRSGASSRPNLERADLGLANLKRANLLGASLSGANLGGANLSAADLRGANLRGANLLGASLSGANLSGANLIGADLRGANLKRADLRGARGVDHLRATLKR